MKLPYGYFLNGEEIAIHEERAGVIRNTLEFLRQWENDMNEEFDDRACEELIHHGHTTSLTITPSLWIRKTHAVGMRVKQGKGGGVSAYPEIVADFHLWLDPKVRLAIVRGHK